VDCPGCNGKGAIAIPEISDPNALDVVYTSTQLTDLRRVCDTPVIHDVTVNTTLANRSVQPWRGLIEARILEMESGLLAASQYEYVDIPGTSTQTCSFDVIVNTESLAQTGVFIPHFEALIAPAQGKVTCPLCGGKGKMPLIALLIQTIERRNIEKEIAGSS
jgi:hypothetical protein